MYLKHGLVALLALGPVSAAWAVPATDEGAARLKGVFQTYFGGTEGVVTVTPKGETYDLVIDAKPLLAQIPDKTMKVEVGALTYHLTDNGDGTWSVSENQVMSWSVNVPGVMEQTASTKIELTGIWDEALPGFREQKAVMTGYTVNTTQYQPAPVPVSADGTPAPETGAAEPGAAEPVLFSRDTQSTDKFELTLTGKAGTAGGVDYDMAYRAEGSYQTAEYTDLNGFGPMKFDATIPGYDGAARISGLRSQGVLGLLGWFVAHPSQELIAGSQDGLRDKLSAAMPLWEDATMDMSLRDMKIGSPFGEFGIGSAIAQIDMSGVEAEGKFREMVTLGGLKVPAGLAPQWAQPILPTEISFDFSVSGFNLAAPAKLIIEGFDLKAELPLEKVSAEQLQSAFFGGKPVLLGLAPSAIKGEGYEIGYQGEASIDPNLPPAMKAKVTATGLDKIQAALQAAPPEQAQQPLMMLQMAQMMGKPGPNGELVWDIDATDPSGAVSVNGTVMGGAPAPQQ